MKRAKSFFLRLAGAVSGLFLLALSGFAADATNGAKARSIVLLPPSGHEASDQEIVRWQLRVAEKSDNSTYWDRLGWAYVAKARLTQDAGFYKLAELTADAWEVACGVNDSAQLLRGHVDHNLHRFRDAERIARELVTHQPSPAAYALLSDALMEQGQLEGAVAACQQLVNLRPGLEAYTRIAHLRWLFGDLEGANEAMLSALRAVDSHDRETRAWIYSRLAGYQLLRNNPSHAIAFAEEAIRSFENHPLAIAVKGRALYAKGEYENALIYLRRAADLNPIPENQWWLADALRELGRTNDAAELETKLRQRGVAVDPRTVALFLATREEDPRRATDLAREGLQNRGDVFTHDALAFALLRGGNTDEAGREMGEANAHHTADPRLALHAGIFARTRGDRAEAERCFERAQAMQAALTPSEQKVLGHYLGRTVASVH